MDRPTDAEIPVRFLAAAVAVAALVLASCDTNHSPSNVKGTPAAADWFKAGQDFARPESPLVLYEGSKTRRAGQRAAAHTAYGTLRA
jgi:hypothetical protein